MALTENQIHTLQKLLSNLESHTELEATAVVTLEGMRIACAVSGDLDADVYSAASAALVNLGETTLKQLNHGTLKEIIVRGDDGYTILTRAGSSYMVVGSCKIGSRMGYYLALLHRFCKKVEEIVESKGPAAVTPAPTVSAAQQLSSQPAPTPVPRITPSNVPQKPVQTMPRASDRDKAALESALDALSMLEESEPPSSISSGASIAPETQPTPVSAPSYSESSELEDALKTLGASTPTVDVNTDALIDAIGAASSKESKPTTQVPFTSSAPTTPSTTSSNDDIFNISDKEAVLEALKVLGWEEDENE
ncbi:MAG: roadblock/LC7 domain-containing protein [Candidatus Helarchaeota archaeon]